MPQRSYETDGRLYPLSSDAAWSIDSSSLTPAGQVELLRNLGRQLQAGYRDVLREPMPDRFSQLLDRLEERRSGSRTREA